MQNGNKKKKEAWCTLVFIISILFIVFMWARKDVAAIYSTLPKEQIVPFVVTNVLVSLVKVGVIAGGVFLIKWLIGKIRQGKH